MGKAYDFHIWHIGALGHALQSNLDTFLINLYLCKLGGFESLNFCWLPGHVTNLHKKLIKNYSF